MYLPDNPAIQAAKLKRHEQEQKESLKKLERDRISHREHEALIAEKVQDICQIASCVILDAIEQGKQHCHLRIQEDSVWDKDAVTIARRVKEILKAEDHGSIFTFTEEVEAQSTMVEVNRNNRLQEEEHIVYWLAIKVSWLNN